MIPTLSGHITPAELGFTLAHEHIFVHDEGVIQNFPNLWDRTAAILLAREKLTAAYRAGVRTILDMSVLGNGRNIADVQEATQGLPIHVVAATGVFYPEHLPGYFHTQSVDVLARCLVQDLTVGISGTDVRAGIIKACTDTPGLTEDVEKSLRAAARAHSETGAPIHTHTAGRSGLLQQRVFQEEGVDLRRVYFGHVMDCPDLDYIHALLDQGSLIGFDRFASAPPDAPRIRSAISVLTQLCQEGWAGQILIGNDGCCYQTVVRLPPPEHSPSLDTNDYLVFQEKIVPALLQAGVTPLQLHQMTVENPKKLFAPELL